MSYDILSVEEVGSLLDLSTSAIWRLLQQGDIPGAKIGGQWRVRRDDLDRHFDLARAKALSQTRQRETEEAWQPILRQLSDRYKGEFVLARCLWCPELVPASESARHTTLCSQECEAELRQTFELLGWPIDWEFMLSPIYDHHPGDCEYWIRLSLNQDAIPVDLMLSGMGRDPDGVHARWTLRHDRGPLRELLLLEHPVLRRHAAGRPSERVAAGAKRRGARSRAPESEVAEVASKRTQSSGGEAVTPPQEDDTHA